MGTRATYQFICEDNLKICFYVSYDTHPNGTAEYFRRMESYQREYPFINLASAFVNVVPDITILKRPYCMTDLDYRYTINAQGTVVAITLSKDETEKVRFFKGHYMEFIKKYLKNNGAQYARKEYFEEE